MPIGLCIGWAAGGGVSGGSGSGRGAAIGVLGSESCSQQDQVPPQDAEPQEPPERRPLKCPRCQVLYSEVHGLG